MDDGLMDGEEARAVIRFQEEHTRLRLKEAILDHGYKAQALADELEQWRGRSANFWGTATKPGALKAFYEAYEWLGGGAMPGDIEYRIVTPRKRVGPPGPFPRYLCLDLDRYPERLEWRHREIRSGKCDSSIESVYSSLQMIVQMSREATVVGPVLDLYPEVHPPRYGKLPDGVIARTLSEDIAAVIAQGRALDGQLAAGMPPLPALRLWMNSASALPAPGAICRYGNGFINVCGSSLVPDTTALGRAYLALTLEYLEELVDRLPDYAEASGQSKHDLVTVHGNVGVIGPVTKSNISVAETVTNIGTTADAIAGRGTDLAAALHALTEAIRQASELAEDQRAQLLDNVADIADAAAAPDEPRSLSRARAAMAMITSAAGASTQLAQAASTLNQVAGQLF